MEAGGEPARFWNITPAEAFREMKAFAALRDREQRQMAWLAWHIEALSRTKKLPPLKDLTGSGAKRQRGSQDPDVLLANMKLAFGYTGETKQ